MADPAIVDLSDEQRRVFDPGVRVVEAGPGSGKTRALVARYVQHASRMEDGAALLSFTNAAVDEVRRRAATDPRLLSAPHFVGTIDGFLHRFIVTPRMATRLRRAPSYLASWNDLPDSFSDRVVRLRTVPGAGIPLAKFAPRDGSIVLEEGGLDSQERHYLSQVESAGERARLVARGGDIIRRLFTSGVMDSSTSRAFAASVLRGEHGPNIVRRLGARFGLLLVDEAQDCDEAEMAVFESLESAITTVIVADPDQAVYEFRGGSPEAFANYRDRRPAQARVLLSTNYRSTTAICAAVSALRAASQLKTVSALRQVCPPVLVVSGSRKEQRTKFSRALSEAGIATNDSIVLAHRASTARGVAGAPKVATSAACGNRLARACAVMEDLDAAPSERLAAIRDVEQILLSMLNWSTIVPTPRTTADRLKVLGRTHAWLRVTAGALIHLAAAAEEPAELGRIGRETCAAALAGLTVPASAVGTRMKRPDLSGWNARRGGSEPGRLPYATIHSRKGHEFKAVLVALAGGTGNDGALVGWEGGLNTEARRVLYVAASRAEQLLAFGADAPTSARIAMLLERAEVPVSVV